MPASIAPGSAPQKMPAVQADSAMPAHRVAAFRSYCAGRVREFTAANVNVSEAIQALRAEQILLTAALSDTAFRDLFAQAFMKAFNARMAPNFAVPVEEARRSVASILEHRVADAKTFAQLLATPDFMEQVKQEAMQPAAAPKVYSLPPEKQKETAERLVQESDLRGPEGATHVLGYAMGQAIEHDALAEVYAPNGPLVMALRQTLQAMTGGGTPQQLQAQQRIADDWVAARYKPARATADGLMPNGALYQAAAARADQLQYGKPQSFAERVMQSRDEGILMDRI